jgi:DNA-binding response OmpR family regulator
MLALRNLRIVLVEDDPELARTVERVLARYGHVTTIATTVAAAEALTSSFDCGILDIDLPDGNGVTLAGHMLDEGRVGVVVFYSASTDAAVMASASELGPFVAKSAGTRELERALAEALSIAARQVAGGGGPVGASGPRRKKSGSRRKTNGNR